MSSIVRLSPIRNPQSAMPSPPARCILSRAMTITTLEQLESIYGRPAESSIIKEVTRLTPEYRKLIEASPFAALATAGPDGLDCSPRGDAVGSLVRIADDSTLLLPDRRGNNRIDSLRNILQDPRVGLLFLIPGSGTTLRVNGRATLTADPALLRSFAVDDQLPRCVITVHIDTVFFQCARAIVRSDLWNPAKHADPASLPTPGQILARLSGDKVDAATYDRQWPERARKSLW
jgi:PPOX class probable FMN-dependent enzyme